MRDFLFRSFNKATYSSYFSTLLSFKFYSSSSLISCLIYTYELFFTLLGSLLDLLLFWGDCIFSKSYNNFISSFLLSSKKFCNIISNWHLCASASLMLLFISLFFLFNSISKSIFDFSPIKFIWDGLSESNNSNRFDF